MRHLEGGRAQVWRISLARTSFARASLRLLTTASMAMLIAAQAEVLAEPVAPLSLDHPDSPRVFAWLHAASQGQVGPLSKQLADAPVPLSRDPDGREWQWAIGALRSQQLPPEAQKALKSALGLPDQATLLRQVFRDLEHGQQATARRRLREAAARGMATEATVERLRPVLWWQWWQPQPMRILREEQPSADKHQAPAAWSTDGQTLIHYSLSGQPLWRWKPASAWLHWWPSAERVVLSDGHAIQSLTSQGTLWRQRLPPGSRVSTVTATSIVIQLNDGDLIEFPGTTATNSARPYRWPTIYHTDGSAIALNDQWLLWLDAQGAVTHRRRLPFSRDPYADRDGHWRLGEHGPEWWAQNVRQWRLAPAYAPIDQLTDAMWAADGAQAQQRVASQQQPSDWRAQLKQLGFSEQNLRAAGLPVPTTSPLDRETQRAPLLAEEALWPEKLWHGWRRTDVSTAAVAPPAIHFAAWQRAIEAWSLQEAAEQPHFLTATWDHLPATASPELAISREGNRIFLTHMAEYGHRASALWQQRWYQPPLQPQVQLAGHAQQWLVQTGDGAVKQYDAGTGTLIEQRSLGKLDPYRPVVATSHNYWQLDPPGLHLELVNDKGQRYPLRQPARWCLSFGDWLLLVDQSGATQFTPATGNQTEIMVPPPWIQTRRAAWHGGGILFDKSWWRLSDPVRPSKESATIP